MGRYNSLRQKRLVSALEGIKQYIHDVDFDDLADGDTLHTFDVGDVLQGIDVVSQSSSALSASVLSLVTGSASVVLGMDYSTLGAGSVSSGCSAAYFDSSDTLQWKVTSNVCVTGASGKVIIRKTSVRD